jgi:hypothetical protein
MFSPVWIGMATFRRIISAKLHLYQEQRIQGKIYLFGNHVDSKL